MKEPSLIYEGRRHTHPLMFALDPTHCRTLLTNSIILVNGWLCSLITLTSVVFPSPDMGPVKLGNNVPLRSLRVKIKCFDRESFNGPTN